MTLEQATRYSVKMPLLQTIILQVHIDGACAFGHAASGLTVTQLCKDESGNVARRLVAVKGIYHETGTALYAEMQGLKLAFDLLRAYVHVNNNTL